MIYKQIKTRLMLPLVYLLLRIKNLEKYLSSEIQGHSNNIKNWNIIINVEYIILTSD